VSNIPTNVELSCAQHPRLKLGAALPRNGVAEISQQRLFALGTLTLQTATKPALATYDLVVSRWENLHGIYADWLQFETNQITTDATSETLTRLSEIVGVALGVAALDAEFHIQINRFQRFQPGGAGRRVDFEYYADGQRFFHETKGTTYNEYVQTMCDDIASQKESTLETVQALGTSGGTMPVNVSGLTGSVALYRQVSRPETSCLITLIDPPVKPQRGARRATEADELACVLRYYRNFYRVTLPLLTNVRSIRLDLWLDEVITGLESGAPAPNQSPANLRTNARAIEPGIPDSPYRGAFFDARFTRRSVLRYPTLAEATAKIASPVSFLGVSNEVTETIRLCRWDDLLSYRDLSAGSPRDHVNGREILESGVLCKRVDPEEVIGRGSSKDYESLRKIARRNVKTSAGSEL
jgi:hypothetical protein